MTMHTTGEPSGSYGGDPPTMSLRQIPDQPFMPSMDAQQPQYDSQHESPYGPQPTMQLGTQLPPPRQPAEQPPAEAEEAPAAKESSAGRNGLIMALGSLTSRALGFVRAGVIAAALGVGPLADGYAVATLLPNTVYLMLIGGVLNSVFVPELVRAAQTHKDRGVAYTNRLLTVCGVALIAITLVAWLFAPQIVDSYTNYSPEQHVQRALTIALARYCLPAILFYGVFGLLGQVLNARDRFGAMMWAPVMNNVVVIGVFGLYIAICKHAESADQVSSGATMLLGAGSAFGILLQALSLLPSLRASGFRYRPRFDWRGAGLTTPLRAAGWALMLVVVTQLSFNAITNMATGAGSQAHTLGLKEGLGYTPYNNAYLLFVVPQGIITVSMVTAILPSMSRAVSSSRFEEVGRELAQTLRSSAGMIIPATAIFLSLASPIIGLAYGHGSVIKAADVEVMAEMLMAFAIGLPSFCAQYALARGFYAMSDARTPFWLTTVIAGSNVALSAVAYFTLSPRWIIVGMGVAQTVATTLGMVITGRALGKQLRTKAAAALPSDATLEIGGGRRSRGRSGLDGSRVVTLHLALALACAPGALAAHWLAGQCAGALGSGIVGNFVGLSAGSLAVLLSLFVLAKPLGAAEAVAPLARKLRIPYAVPEPAASGGKHRR
ncbi:murein biosynthesis integral membrane protein MurJ [Kitasatospora sp. GP82]|uniref:murein biosynthesis integral membrane protein MurJ n=1 Tax=Kitasatospora sp. GP82 TaxID=3035089 RepID=UPI002473A9BC|nr:murein biosynthesis integral membrane protein MurJ [Kitasatospora sp. GP82]MDH6127941.1 putative peptidoglycan lipid II flippase [Kitasatospora sp. GP82]